MPFHSTPRSPSHIGVEATNYSVMRPALLVSTLHIVPLTSVTVAGHEASANALNLMGSRLATRKDGTLYRFHGN